MQIAAGHVERAVSTFNRVRGRFTALAQRRPSGKGSNAIPPRAAKTATLTFTPGMLSRQFRVVVKGEAVAEGDESFFVNLSDPSPAEVTIADNRGIGTILSDDAGVSANDVTVLESNSGATTEAVFTVSLAEAVASAVRVNYATLAGTATAGSDYTAVSGQLSFDPGVTTQTIAVPILGDDADEADETLQVDLRSPVGCSLANRRGEATITDDAAAPSVSINDVEAALSRPRYGSLVAGGGPAADRLGSPSLPPPGRAPGGASAYRASRLYLMRCGWSASTPSRRLRSAS